MPKGHPFPLLQYDKFQATFIQPPFIMPPSKSFQIQFITRWGSILIVNQSCLSLMFSTLLWALKLIQLLSVIHHSLLSGHYEIVISYLRNQYMDVLVHLVKGQQHSYLTRLNLFILLPLLPLLTLHPILVINWFAKVWFPQFVHDFFLPLRIDYEG